MSPAVSAMKVTSGNSGASFVTVVRNWPPWKAMMLYPSLMKPLATRSASAGATRS